MTFAQQTNDNTFAAQQSFDAAEYVVYVLESGAIIYEECDIIVLDL